MDIFGEVNHWEKTEGASIFCSIINVPNPVILDYGCGAGNYSFAAAYAFDQKCKVCAVDINGQCLEYVNQKARDEGIDCITTSIGREDYRHHLWLNKKPKGRRRNHNYMHADAPALPYLNIYSDILKSKYTYKKLIDEICSYGFTYTGKDQEGIHFEKVYSPYYQQKGGITFDGLERGKMLIFELTGKPGP